MRAKQPAQLGPRRIVDLARIDCGTDDCVGAAPLPFLLDQADSRERQLPVAQVTADRLAERLPVGREVEQVIDELERDAEIEAVVAQRRALLRRRVGQPATDLGRAAEEVRRLPLDDVEVIRLGDIDVTRFRQLVELSLDHPSRHVAQQADHVDRVVGERHLHRLDVEVVAKQNGDVIPPPRVDREAAAAHVGFVDDVVVHQGRGVDVLHDRRVGDGPLSLVSA